MSVVRTAVGLGVALGIYTIAAVFLIVEYLPASFGWLIPVGALAVAIAMLWPHWFDRPDPAGVGRRLVRRLAVAGAAVPIGALTAFLTVTAVPSFIAWSDNQHRAALSRRGMAAAEIEQQVATHHQEPRHFLLDGALLTAMPTVIATLVTLVAGAVVFRQRPARP